MEGLLKLSKVLEYNYFLPPCYILVPDFRFSLWRFLNDLNLVSFYPSCLTSIWNWVNPAAYSFFVCTQTSKAAGKRSLLPSQVAGWYICGPVWSVFSLWFQLNCVSVGNALSHILQEVLHVLFLISFCWHFFYSWCNRYSMASQRQSIKN